MKFNALTCNIEDCAWTLCRMAAKTCLSMSKIKFALHSERVFFLVYSLRTLTVTVPL